MQHTLPLFIGGATTVGVLKWEYQLSCVREIYTNEF